MAGAPAAVLDYEVAPRLRRQSKPVPDGLMQPAHRVSPGFPNALAWLGGSNRMPQTKRRKQRKRSSRRCEGWQVQDQRACRPASGESSLPGSQVATPSLCPHVPAGAMEPSPGHLSEAPPSNSNTGIGFQRMHSGGDANIQPAAPTLGLHVRGRAVVCLSLCRWAASPANRILSDLVFASRRPSCSRGEAIRVFCSIRVLMLNVTSW